MKASVSSPQEYRLVWDENSNWYVIPVGEETTFIHWCAAERGERHYPEGFEPCEVSLPENLRFTGWREETT